MLHVGLAAWVICPSSASIVPQQQVIDISVVMISAPESQPIMAANTQISEPVIPVKTKTPQRKFLTPIKQAQEKSETPKQMSAMGHLTSGPEKPDATQKIAATTEPVFNATSLHNTPPAYPELARNRGIEGEVMLEVNVTPDGTAQTVDVKHSSGCALLDRTARDAISHWHFVPAQHDGQVVEAKVDVPVEFRLE